MKSKQSTEHEILNVLKDYNSGKSGLELFRKYGVYGTNIFELKQKYKDLEPNILKAIIDLHEENCRLKTMYADVSIQYRKLQDSLKEGF
ncbi:putative transposase [Chryseobacterium sp. 52]|uniref:hypothetical protein n=1 Tax=Chryseobacterium sp. 52 TaxID=2035213 RepID=UPI000C17BDE3|nr:hypothetical protein [Chryseobacterium sp. 52]PIF46514.1 putative transposase [Chryseobacterium sp. 52]